MQTPPQPTRKRNQDPELAARKRTAFADALRGSSAIRTVLHSEEAFQRDKDRLLKWFSEHTAELLEQQTLALRRVSVDYSQLFLEQLMTTRQHTVVAEALAEFLRPHITGADCVRVQYSHPSKDEHRVHVFSFAAFTYDS